MSRASVQQVPLRWGPILLHPPTPALPQVLANKVRAKVQEARSANRAVSAADGFCPSTVRLLNRFLEQVREHF